MTQATDSHILLIEADPELKKRIDTLLSSETGIRVSAFDRAKDALAFLETQAKQSIALIISSYKMHEMSGDEVLRKAREISWFSRRMLISDISDIDTMINAVNTADIHACMVLPFTDDELISQAKEAIGQYRDIKNKDHLTRVTRRQNKQLFKLASELKKLDEKSVHDIRERKAVIKALLSKISAVQGQSERLQKLSVKQYLLETGKELSPEGMRQALQELKEQIRAVMDSLFPGSVSQEDISCARIKDPSLVRKEYLKPAAKLMPRFLAVFSSPPSPVPDQEEDVATVTFEGDDDMPLELVLSQDQVKAFLTLKKSGSHGMTLETLKTFLAINRVISGLKPDHEIQAWLDTVSVGDKPFTVASGRPPSPPEDARVRYYFPKDYRQAGTLKEDGTFDFTDRGKIPFVKKDTLLAQKVYPVAGIPGMTVTGDGIAVPEPVDIPLAAGPGARMSEDGVDVFADSDGQPFLDALGNLSVLSELNIKGDVDFETGNIDFSGNLIVKGTIKPGFRVKAASLTVQQIEGAHIVLTGDLTCSGGIIDATLVRVQGDIHAKYINNSVIEGFGDLSVQKEIIDSKIQMSGAILNPTGAVIASRISAKMGIDAGSIGTDMAKPSRLVVGVDKYVRHLVSVIESDRKTHAEGVAELEKSLSELEKENHDLHAAIAAQAHVQDRAQLELQDIEKKLSAVRAAKDMGGIHQLEKSARRLEARIKSVEHDINSGFERQDAIARDIPQKKEKLSKLRQTIQNLEKEKQALLALTEKKESVPEVKVSRTIRSGTRIDGPHATMTLDRDLSRCKIMEIKRSGEELHFYEMQVVTEV